MDIEKIIDDLNKQFLEPLPDFYSRRIIFWIDEEGDFLDQIDNLKLSNAKIIKLNGKNNFEAKKILCFDDTKSNYVVYRPFSIDDNDNWLLNIELYSSEYRSDRISNWLNEMGIPNKPYLRKIIKEYKKFFNSKERRKKISAFNIKKKIIKKEHLYLGVMASICNLNTTNPNEIIKAVLENGLEVAENNTYNDFINYKVDKAFWVMIEQATGYREGGACISRMAMHIILTGATRTINIEYLENLKTLISQPHQSYCYDFVSEWLRGVDNEEAYKIIRFVEEKVNLIDNISRLEIENILNTECFPCIDEYLLSKIMGDINNDVFEISMIEKVIQKRRTFVWYKKFNNYYDGVLQISNMKKFYIEYSANFHTLKAEKLWLEYIEKFYKMDTYYRLYHLSFTKSLKNPNCKLDDLFKETTSVVERVYSNWFLEKLGENWTKCSEDELEKYGHISGISKQVNFYKEKVETSDSRMFVIISDALRYEVAVSLTEKLQRESQAKIELNTMQAIFPTITKFGMAALLPNKELRAEVKNGKLSVLADGMSTESNYRDKVLKSYNSKSIAVKFSDIDKMKRAEKNELIKGNDVIYIYHDKIDEASHTSDASVFPACEDAIVEIKTLIRTMVNDLSATKIIITADHGFLYTYSPLLEDSKIDSKGFKNKIVDYGRRYAIVDGDDRPEYLLPIKIFEGKSSFTGYAPRGSIRIKMSGGGLNFVHGGISLQEMVVPVIEYHHLRNNSKEYLKNKQKYDTKPVTLSLATSGKKISNMYFSLNFYQEEAVSSNRDSATYLLYFEDNNGMEISDIQKIIADKEDNDISKRTFRVNFNLKPLKYSNTETYNLVIKGEDELSLSKREDFEINIPLATDDFNFFD